MGLNEIFLEDLTRDQVLMAAAEARSGTQKERAGTPKQEAAPKQEATRKHEASPEHATARVAPSRGDGVEISAPDLDLANLDYTEFKAVTESCQRCRLAKGRTQVVFSDGNPQARLMVVGEAPGANEDRTGLPFVGQAGKFLDLLLAAVDLSRRDSVYICNVLKCRPPGNRDPMADEIELCSPFLKGQIALVAPEVILAVGTFAAQLLTGTNRPLGKLRGSVYAYEGVPLVVTYHPAALLRNAGWTRSTWDDLQLLREVMDGS
jgi:DNA polymerase